MADIILKFVTSFCLLAFSGLLGYWIQDRDPPVDILEAKILTPVIKPGDAVKVIYFLNRKRLCHVRVEQVIYDSDRVRYSPTTLDYVADPGSRKLGEDPIGYAVEVPTHFQEGPGFHRAVRAYYCNPIHELLSWPIILIGPDIPFEVRR